MISQTDMDATTPMFARYSRCTGETLRRAVSPRSSGRPCQRSGTSGTGVYVASGMSRSHWVR
ncbi:MAG: hypothetical protein M3P93_09155 [Actinomycetota bacterium]|nr:hypothetical protein [Actinomycetota bacterium]